jgi:BirA family biotin operon repressor/biotin-[acetyl-CoA-carboxylase] ligase
MGGSPYTDLNRPPLKEAALRRALVVPDSLWTELRVAPETGSTNADVAAAARAGAAEGLILVAESQTAGRGRLERDWLAPARSSLTLSILLRPAVPAPRLGWLPLLAGVALVQAVGRIAVVDAVLKWPNDLLVRSAAAPADYGKCAGILAEAVTGGVPSDGAPSGGETAVVLGIGLNVTQAADELPGARANLPATSLALVGAASTDRDPLLRGMLRTLADWYGRWVEAVGDPEAAGLAAAYRESCFTLGQQVAVSLPAGEVIEGTAVAIDDDGQLVVSTDRGDRPVAAGDVEHVR